MLRPGQSDIEVAKYAEFTGLVVALKRLKSSENKKAG